MCGISGLYLSRPLAPSDQDLAEGLKRALGHRGPDHEATWSRPEKGISLGHNRLSILDLDERSNQPMQREESVLAFNGEIYNYVEIRRELIARGETFATDGDTEVLIKAWRHWGPQCLTKFDGMFAFALYDSEGLHLVTDPFGEKPLYYLRTPEGVAFASEPKPLIKAYGLKFEPTPEEEFAFLTLGFFPDSSQPFSGLKRLGPATHITLQRDGNTQERRYWKPPQVFVGQETLEPMPKASVDRIQELLLGSLERRLRSHVPMALFLSSGVDSSLVAAMVAKDTTKQLQAVTIQFPHQDESTLASKIAAHLGLEHITLNSEEDPLQARPDFPMEVYGEPVDNLTVASVYQMSRLIRENYKAALSGLGADELFYGYNKYAALNRYQRIFSRVSPSLRVPLSKALKLLPLWSSQEWSEILRAGPEQMVLRLKNYQQWSKLSKSPHLQTLAHRFFSGGEHLVLQARNFDLEYTMPFNFIPPMERGSMACGLEVRTPYLSVELVEYLSTLDQRHLFEGGLKSVLYTILRRYLPEDLIEGRKLGFNYPVSKFVPSQDTQESRRRVLGYFR